MKLEVRLFRFDVRHDYLPSYHPFLYKTDGDLTLGELLRDRSKNDPLFKCDLGRVAGVRVNGLGVNLNVRLEALTRKTGYDLNIEPLASERAVLDLEMNTSDFDEKFALFAELTDAGDRDFYNRYQIAYYLSPMRKLNPAYPGEAIFMLAGRLLEKHPDQLTRILKTINCSKTGIFLYPGLNSVLFEGAEEINTAILTLQQKIVQAGLAPKDAVVGVAFQPALAAELSVYNGKRVALVTDSGPFGPAIDAFAYESALKNAGASVARLDNPGRFSGASLAALQPELARKAAAALLLEAMDRGAEELVCACAEVAKFLSAEFKAIEREARQPVQIGITTLQSNPRKVA